MCIRDRIYIDGIKTTDMRRKDLRSLFGKMCIRDRTDTERQYMKECMTHMQENLQMFITLLGEEDARALVRILEKAIAFYQQHHGPTTSKEEGDRTC